MSSQKNNLVTNFDLKTNFSSLIMGEDKGGDPLVPPPIGNHSYVDLGTLNKEQNFDFSEYVQKSDYSDWNNVKIPMKKFPIRSSKIDLKKIKSIIFSFAEDSKLKIDNIKLIN